MAKKSVGTIPRKDRDPQKRFPNGIKAVMRSVRKFWPKDVGSDQRGALDFAKEFLETYNRISSYYGDREPKAPKHLAKMVQRLESNGRDHGRLHYGQLKAFAEFLEEIPVPMFLLFAQCVSYEANRRSRKDILELLERSERVTIALQDYVRGGEAHAFLFHVPQKGGKEYHARLQGLRIVLNAFQRIDEGKSSRQKALRK